MTTANNTALNFTIPSRQIHTEISFELNTDFQKRAIVIADQTAAKLFGTFDLEAILVPSGERYKTRETKAWIEDQLLAMGCDRETVLVGFGGGALLDLAGFAASTFYRGLSLVLIPTTLLAMVDACLGGKTAVNTDAGKNLIGSFYFPKKIMIDTAFLKTLPEKQWLNGKAEMVKYGLIRSKELFYSKEPLEALIPACLTIKKAVVEADPYETTGLRRILNFGHTFGHALEQASSYQIEHGQAVQIGLYLESWLSCRLGLLKKEAFEEIPPAPLSFPVDRQKVLQAIAKDKKGSRFVLLKAIGEVEPFGGDYCTPVAMKLVEEAYDLVDRA